MLRVKQVTTEDGFLALEDEWRALVDGSETSLFLTWEWVSTWWRHFGQGLTPWLLTARDHAGVLVGIAPWCITPSPTGLMRTRRLMFLGSSITHSAHVDVIASPCNKKSVTTAFIEYLHRHRGEWDILEFAWLPEDSYLRSHLTPLDGLYTVSTDIFPYVRLPADWQEYEMEILPARRRQELRRYVRRLERDFPEQVKIERIDDPDEAVRAMDMLSALQSRRLSGNMSANIFEDDQFVPFFRNIVAVSANCGWLRFYRLKVDDHVVALNCCILFRGRLHGYHRALDPEWMNYSPGFVLQAHVFREAIDEGVDEFDMLHGGQTEKSVWTDTVRKDARMIASGSWKGALTLAAGAGRYRFEDLGRRTLYPPVRRITGYVTAKVKADHDTRT